jgi:hypothetical protein
MVRHQLGLRGLAGALFGCDFGQMAIRRAKLRPCPSPASNAHEVPKPQVFEKQSRVRHALSWARALAHERSPLLLPGKLLAPLFYLKAMVNGSILNRNSLARDPARWPPMLRPGAFFPNISGAPYLFRPGQHPPGIAKHGTTTRRTDARPRVIAGIAHLSTAAGRIRSAGRVKWKSPARGPGLFACTVANLFGGKERFGLVTRKIDGLEELDPIFGNVIADHAIAFSFQFVHVNIHAIERLGAIGDDAGIQQRFDQHAEDVGGFLHLLTARIIPKSFLNGVHRILRIDANRAIDMMHLQGIDEIEEQGLEALRRPILNPCMFLF